MGSGRRKTMALIGVELEVKRQVEAFGRKNERKKKEGNGRNAKEGKDLV